MSECPTSVEALMLGYCAGIFTTVVVTVMIVSFVKLARGGSHDR